MPARKMRVEVYDEDGNRYAITFDGRVTIDKARRVFDIVELLGGMPSVESEWERRGEISKIDKLRFIIEKNFPAVWFNAKDAQVVYEREIKEPMSLSSISTYLSRLANRGILTRSRNSNKVQYRVMSENLQKMFNLKNFK